MRRVFADAAYYIALLHPRDELHPVAKALAQELETTGSIVTTELVLVEVLNFFAEKPPQLRVTAAQFVDAVHRSATTKVIPLSHLQYDAARQLYAQREDKGWSLTDCASVIVMQQESLIEAATHDQHFEQAGFKALLRRSGPGVEA